MWESENHMSFLNDPSLATMDAVDAASDVAMNTVTTQIEHTSDILSKYGTGVVLMAFFLVIFAVVFFSMMAMFRRTFNKKLDENPVTKEFIVATINSCVSEVMEINKNSIIQGIEESTQKEKDSHKNIVSVYIDSEKVFREASIEAIKEIKCQRLAIYLFHNGNSTPYGYPFAKMSCVHEVTNKGVHCTPRGQAHINVPLYVFSDLVEGLNENGEVIVEDVRDLIIEEEDNQLGTFMQGEHVESVFVSSIKNHDGCLVSFTIAEFHDKQDFTNEERLDQIREALQDMDKSIYHIIVNDEFVDNYQEES